MVEIGVWVLRKNGSWKMRLNCINKEEHVLKWFFVKEKPWTEEEKKFLGEVGGRKMFRGNIT